MAIIRYVGTNDRGIAVGKFHHRCKHSDELVDRVRAMHEEEGMGYRSISKITGLSRWTVRDICQYTRRAQTYTGWKKVEG
jgi:transposase